VKKRDEFWDIVKAIGIISIVIGHCFPFANSFVYTYHLVIFFFVGGYLYNGIKYAKNPFEYIGHKLSSTLPKYFCYYVLFILIHNILVQIGIYASTTSIYSIKDIAAQILSASVFLGPSGMGGALWFVPFFVYSMILFCFMTNFVGKIKDKKYQMILLGFISILLGFIGIKLAIAKYGVIYHLQASLIVIPIIYLGYLLKHIPVQKFYKYLRLYICIPCIIFILLVLKYTGKSIDLSSSNIISPILFYPISIAGIYFVLYLAKVILDVRKGIKLFSYIGEHSYDIMALHFLMFKLVDLVYVWVRHKDIELLSAFPCSNERLWPIYIIAGIFGSLVVCKFIEETRMFINKKLQKLNILELEEKI
jgi:fucose 4-O-acetylase-like acetyltransferase